ncbi:MAG: adenylyltransferase/cytidyltransferase family protein, partial [Lachnospiraceae bacterium]|nr:adenylyltransferase/cytidyltransferase family protein [Lachnospiraceae bacterium]
MIKVITYGTFDMLHYGHRRLLERAKALGDYLIVGVTAEDFDMNRGKVNVHQSLMERIAGVRATGIADEIIVEEYEGQKIDDIQRYNVDIFTLGSDWVGKYDYLNEYCQVIYLPRTEGISSSDIREEEDHLSIGVIGGVGIVEEKFIREGSFVTGVSFTGLCFSKDNVSEGDKVTISERAQAAKMFKDAHLSGDDSNYLL